ncbi:hypothetical protein CVT25_001265 [Psilocybe cyanescens]|uniref:Uncharacterized protein n=1 Tax=Psilocybe cyanescens TaxID=93625 RepID=A0A409XAT1_PSICY|nr:hypothetical protein CVT25_001265 [Psilocybe cyanescens]
MTIVVIVARLFLLFIFMFVLTIAALIFIILIFLIVLVLILIPVMTQPLIQQSTQTHAVINSRGRNGNSACIAGDGGGDGGGDVRRAAAAEGAHVCVVVYVLEHVRA